MTLPPSHWWYELPGNQRGTRWWFLRLQIAPCLMRFYSQGYKTRKKGKSNVNVKHITVYILQLQCLLHFTATGKAKTTCLVDRKTNMEDALPTCFSRCRLLGLSFPSLIHYLLSHWLWKCVLPMAAVLLSHIDCNFPPDNVLISFSL